MIGQLGLNGWPQILAGFIHVAMKCCTMEGDRGHLDFDKGKGKLKRCPPILNNVHKFDGAGVQTAGWIEKVLKELSVGRDNNNKMLASAKFAGTTY